MSNRLCACVRACVGVCVWVCVCVCVVEPKPSKQWMQFYLARKSEALPGLSLGHCCCLLPQSAGRKGSMYLMPAIPHPKRHTKRVCQDGAYAAVDCSEELEKSPLGRLKTKLEVTFESGKKR